MKKIGYEDLRNSIRLMECIKHTSCWSCPLMREDGFCYLMRCDDLYYEHFQYNPILDLYDKYLGNMVI